MKIILNAYQIAFFILLLLLCLKRCGCLPFHHCYGPLAPSIQAFCLKTIDTEFAFVPMAVSKSFFKVCLT